MQFGPDAATEIIAPAGVPFAPGNDVIGFGTAVPPLLAAAGIPAAILFYNSGYSATSTFPSVKYAFIGSFNGTSGSQSIGGIVYGMGIVTNPSVSQVEVVKISNTMVMLANTTTPFNPALAFEQINFGQTATVAVMTHGTTSGPGDTQNGIVETFSSTGTNTGHLP